MTTYAEKADIAAKAVKVLDSVTMKRHQEPARKYAKLAARIMIDKSVGRNSEARSFDDGSGIGFYVLNPGHSVVDALNRMNYRLDKPRYTLKDGEWVRKDSIKAEGGRYLGLSGGDAQKIMSAPVMTGCVRGQSSVTPTTGYFGGVL